MTSNSKRPVSERVENQESKATSFDPIVIGRQDLKIVRAAIRVDHGAIFSLPIPARHHDLVRELREIGYKGPVQGDRQGFLLNDGRFVMRKAAGAIARKNGQLRNGKQIANTFTSEDVW